MCDDIAIDDMAKSSKMVASGASNGSAQWIPMDTVGPLRQPKGVKLYGTPGTWLRAFGKSNMENHGRSSINWWFLKLEKIHDFGKFGKSMENQTCKNGGFELENIIDKLMIFPVATFENQRVKYANRRLLVFGCNVWQCGNLHPKTGKSDLPTIA